MFEPVALESVDPGAVEALLDDAFGADRFRRTAYLLRTRSRAIAPLSLAVQQSGQLLGSIQCWPVRIGGFPLVLVGPVAVATTEQGKGIGQLLMHSMLAAAAKIGEPAMVMIGDPEYYERFGFTADATGGWTLPGPWEPRRLLARNAAGLPLPAAGMIEEDDRAL
ncbi:GNAT family N-acetyltransferase [Sphingorhabdus sp.]|jgi:predicted N-acetyltransferase YhbS|uniref:GNAT family N-acetyltransferase n=1 Tax=Sphingorhabdus sp. TaxID=1902408 RepID=UPI0035B4A695|nr:N-acetyltransferase [Sphingomonadaceae bacterium]